MKTVFGYIPKLPNGYWDTPDYYTVLSDDGTQSYAVLIRSDTRDWYWIHPILGEVKTEEQKEIEDVPMEDLKTTSRLKIAPCGVELDAKFIQAQAELSEMVVAADAEAESIVVDKPK